MSPMFRVLAVAAVLVLPAAAQDQDPSVNSKDLQQQVDLLVYRLNTSGLVTKVLELRGREVEARSLRDSMRKMDKDLGDLASKIKGQGRDLYVPDYIKPDDKLTHLDAFNFGKMEAPAAERALVAFVAGIKPGSRARIIVTRGSDFMEFDIRYHSRPKELFAIYQVAGIVPGAATEGPALDPTKPAPPVEPEFDAWGVLVDPAKRAILADRSRASAKLASLVKTSRSPNLVGLSAVFLAQEDAAWKLPPAAAAVLDAHFLRAKPAESEKYDGARHLAMLEALGKDAAPLKAADPAAAHLPLLYAAAHAADALLTGAPEATVAKAAQAAGLRRSGDGRCFGEEAAILVVDLAREVAGGKPQNAQSRYTATWKSHPDFAVRYLGLLLVVAEVFDRNSGGFEACVKQVRAAAAEAGPSAAAHLGALADRIQALARCTQCENGKVKCPKCAGDGKLDVKCKKCDGTGFYEKGGGRVMCNDCRGKGVYKDVECGCGKTGNKTDCTNCKGKTWYPKLGTPDLAEIYTLKTCTHCSGRGTGVPNVALACPFCGGLGRAAIPTGDPAKTLR